MGYHHASIRGRRALFASSVLGIAAVTAPLVLHGFPAVAAPRELPVFEVGSAGLSQEQAAVLGRAFGLKNLDRAEDGSVRFVAEDTFLAVPTKAGKRGKDEDGNPTVSSVLDLAALKRLKPISAATALTRSGKALAGAKLVPAGGRATASNTTVKTVDAKGRATASVAIDTTVSYAFTLAGLPLEGPGAKVRVAYDGKGKPTSLTYSTRSLVQNGVRGGPRRGRRRWNAAPSSWATASRSARPCRPTTPRRSPSRSRPWSPACAAPASTPTAPRRRS